MLLRYKNLYIVPSYHGRINFSQEVRDLFFEINPDAIAVELPESIKENLIKGVNRLPKVSLIVYWDDLLKRYLFVPINPTDSLIFSIRLALENQISCYFIDLNVRAYSPETKNLPDDQAIKSLGLKKFYETVKEAKKEYFNLDNHPFGGFPEYFVDLEVIKPLGGDNKTQKNKLKSTRRQKKDSKSSEKLKKRTDSLDKAREYFMACNLKTLMAEHQKVMVVIGLAHWERIKEFLSEDNLNLDVLNYSPDVESIIYNVSPRNIRMAFNEVPYFNYQWEKQWETNPLEGFNVIPGSFDKTDYIPAIFIKAITEFEKRYEERISVQKLLQISQYLRNLVHYDGRLTPDLYHLIIAAKNICNDDLAWFVYKTANYYPYAIENDDDIPTIQIKHNFFILGDKKVTLRRRIPVHRRSRTVKVHRIREEKHGEEWRKEWENGKSSIFSFPPEDLILENHYRYIKRLGHEFITEKLTKTHKFRGSLMDGIDIRETIRNLIINNGKDIYVKEIKRVRGSITSIVVIFGDEDEKLTPFYQPKAESWAEKYRHNISFLAEHEAESDLTFFSTEPGENLIGPGISIIKMGGFYSEFPPPSAKEGLGFFNCFDPFLNPTFRHCNFKSERLLLSAIFQSSRRYLLYIAKKRPRKYFYNAARSKEKTIIFIPISQFSSTTLNRIKYMHILAGKHRRRYADKYINLKKKFRF